MAQLSSKENNRISELFANKTILITGGTGFLGKVLIEKLLRLCPEVKKIYVLIRPKTTKTGFERLKDTFNDPLFELVKKIHGDTVFEKVEAIAGDLAASNLDLSEADRKKLVEETEIIYHSGASVRFDEPLKNAVLLNVRGTKLMLGLAKECKKLMIFCYVSTAFCHEDREVVYEKTYEAPTNPHHIIEACEWINEKDLDSIAMKIRGVRANNYSFTKALAEALVDEQMESLPVIIQRPSAVTPIWRDPLPGWTDNLNGPTGFLVGAGKGVIRTMHGKKDLYFDTIPVDILINGLLCTAFDYITHRSRRVYNLTSSDEIQATFEDICEMGKHIITTELPFNSFLWCPGGSIRQTRLHHIIVFMFYQLLPALLLDPLLYILGYKPFLVKAQKKIWKGYQILEYYMSRSWLFNKENFRTAQNFLNSTEKAVFNSDLENFNLKDYFTDGIRGARRYLLKDKDEDLPLALKRMRVIFYVDKLLNIVFTGGFFYYFLLILINFLHLKL